VAEWTGWTTTNHLADNNEADIPEGFRPLLAAGWTFLGAAAPVTGSVLSVIQNRDAFRDASEWKTYLGDIDEDYRAIRLLATLPTARLERLFAEHCDLTSYRLDAWLTGYVYQRLLAWRVWPLEKRGAGITPLRPAPGESQLLRYDLSYRPLGPYSPGLYLGAYGWVEAIEPEPLPEPVNGLPAELTPQNGRPVTHPIACEDCTFDLARSHL
jgi:hypothetical protein